MIAIIQNFMTTLILCISIIWFIASFFSIGDEDVGYVFKFSWIMPLTWIILLFYSETHNYNTEIYHISEYELMNLQDNRDIHGRFVLLGRKEIKTKIYYYFYIKIGNEIKLKKIDVDNIKIIINNKIKPKFVIKYSRKVWKENLSILWRIFFLGSRYRGYHEDYFLYIPENAIVKDFRLDAK